MQTIVPARRSTNPYRLAESIFRKALRLAGLALIALAYLAPVAMAVTSIVSMSQGDWFAFIVFSFAALALSIPAYIVGEEIEINERIVNAWNRKKKEWDEVSD